MSIEKTGNNFILNEMNNLQQRTQVQPQVKQAVIPDKFDSESQAKKETFLQEHWGKLALGLIAIVGITSYAFRSKLSKAFSKLGKNAPDVAPKPQVGEEIVDQTAKQIPKELADTTVKKMDNGIVLNERFFENPKIYATETITKGDDVQSRISDFLANPKFYDGYPLYGKGLTPLTQKFALTPHQYDTAAQEIIFSSRTRTADYPQNMLKLSGNNQIYHNGSKLVESFNGGISSEYPHFIIGKTPEGRAFIQYAVRSNRSDGNRIIRETATITSKDGNFTPVQIDLMKTLGFYKNTPDLRRGYFPMLSVAKEHAVADDVAKNLSKANSSRIAVSEDVLLSNIYTWAKHTPQSDNKFLQGYSKLKNGESIIQDLSGLILDNSANWG